MDDTATAKGIEEMLSTICLSKEQRLPKPYYQDEDTTLYNARWEDVLPSLAPESIGLLCTDPPYGFRKAEWDETFTIAWLAQAARVTRHALAIMPGINNVLSLPRQVGGFDYRWLLSIHIANGMTRGLMGFGNWIPVAVYARAAESSYRPQQDATAVSVVGVMPDHPSPKPLRAMSWLLSRFPDWSVLDPFSGSGTTLLAAKQLGRKAIGIEISEHYCALTVERLRQFVLPFAPQSAATQQEQKGLFDE